MRLDPLRPESCGETTRFPAPAHTSPGGGFQFASLLFRREQGILSNWYVLRTPVLVTDGSGTLYKKKERKANRVSNQQKKEKAPPLCVSFIIHCQQMKLVQWEQSIIDERR